MKVKLTDREIIALGYDCRDILDAEPDRRSTAKKCRSGEELLPTEWACLRDDVGMMTADGGPESAIITRLKTKLNKARNSP